MAFRLGGERSILLSYGDRCRGTGKVQSYGELVQISLAEFPLSEIAPQGTIVMRLATVTCDCQRQRTIVNGKVG